MELVFTQILGCHGTYFYADFKLSWNMFLRRFSAVLEHVFTQILGCLGFLDWFQDYCGLVLGR